MSLVQQTLSVVRSRGIRGLAEAVARRVLRRRAACFRECAARVEGKRGLEIGGPSGVFQRSGVLPIYPLVAAIDHCNFSEHTIWENAPGERLIADATNLAGVPDAQYDFVLASHVLEHIANPLRALREWRRVLRRDGLLVVIVPDPLHTFDHLRPVTTIDHLREDARNQVSEDDVTHIPEVLALHDLSRDPEAGSRTEFEVRCRDNARFRAMHHHVFDVPLITAALTEAGFRVLTTETVTPHHIVALANATALR